MVELLLLAGIPKSLFRRNGTAKRYRHQETTRCARGTETQRKAKNENPQIAQINTD
jgi:hypothetical protein